MMKAEGKKVKEPVMSVMASKTYVDRRITELKKCCLSRMPKMTNN